MAPINDGNNRSPSRSPVSPIRQAVIMAAGRGNRLRPLTDSLPKPLLPVAGRPILEWTVERLPPSIKEVLLVVNYRQDQIRRHFGTTWNGRRIRYVEQPEPKGTGDAVHCCRPILDGRFLALNGDDLYGAADIRRLAETAAEAAILVKSLTQTGRFGTVAVTDGRFTAINEQTPAALAAADKPGWVNTGLYLLNQDFFRYPLVLLPSGREYGLPQTLALMAQDRPVTAIKADFWVPIGFPDDLATATAEILKETAAAVQD